MSSNAVRVLVVEDQPDLAAVLRDLLAGDGRVEVVAVCHTLAIATEVLERTRPEVVVTDFRLPDGDAADVFASWRRSVPAMKIVVMSAWTDEGSVRRARLAGADAYLDKATGLGDVAETILRVIDSPDGPAGRWPDTPTDPNLTGPVVPGLATDEQVVGQVLAAVRAGSSTAEIATALHLDERAVREHVNVLLRRHGVRSRADLRRIAPS